MSVWLTPDLKPFFCGTYFPREQFVQLLQRIADVWETNRDAVLQQAGQITGALTQYLAGRGEPETLSDAPLQAAYRQLSASYDREFGGFTCAVNHDGTPINTYKTAWYEGRGIWCYSFMYNHNLARKDKYLDCAQRSVDFILKHRPGGTAHWPATYTREGTVIDRNGSLPGDCYIYRR